MKIFPMPANIKSGCLLYSFAMILEVEPGELIEEIGHNGMAVVWPELPKPYCYQSFHIQELITCCLKRGIHCTEIQAMPSSLPPPQAYMHLRSHNVGHHMIYPVARTGERFKNLLQDQEGVLYGRTPENITHAWAWDGQLAHDPRSGMGCESLSDLRIMTAWLISGSL